MDRYDAGGRSVRRGCRRAGGTATRHDELGTADGMSFPLTGPAASRWVWRDAVLRQASSRGRDTGGTTVARARAGSASGLLIFAVGLLAGARASAQDYTIREVGGWTVTASQDGKGCFLTRAYEGPGETTLLLGLDTDGSNRLSLLNANWSIEEKDRESLDFRLSNASVPRHLAIGIASDGKQGFVTSFGAPFPATFAASMFLHVFRGDVPVEKLSLRGSGAAVAELRRCVAFHRGKRATGARGDDRTGDVPIDPFAREAKRKSRK